MELEHSEHSVFTWDPVGARWIHERGPEMTRPPVPPDVHAIQTYFFDPDGKEWIATVLAPRGRELAAQWEGAHKVPDHAAPEGTPTKKTAKSAMPTKKTSESGPPVPLFAIVLVLLIVGGGAAAVVAGTQNPPNASQAAASKPVASANPSGAASVVPGRPTPVGETPAPTQPPTGTQVVVTRTPAPTAVPTAQPPVGASVTLSDGSVVTYNGPSRVNIGVPFSVSFTVRTTGNAPGTGTFLVSFGNASTGGAKTSSGTLDTSGRLVMNMNGVSLPGNYPFVVNFKGLQGQVTILRVG